MEIKIVKERENPFFKRKDLGVEVKHIGEPTPRTDDLKKELTKICKVDESQILVDYILTKRGVGESTAKVRILNEKPLVAEKPKPAEETSEQTTEKKETKQREGV